MISHSSLLLLYFYCIPWRYSMSIYRAHIILAKMSREEWYEVCEAGFESRMPMTKSVHKPKCWRRFLNQFATTQPCLLYAARMRLYQWMSNSFINFSNYPVHSPSLLIKSGSYLCSWTLIMPPTLPVFAIWYSSYRSNVTRRNNYFTTDWKKNKLNFSLVENHLWIQHFPRPNYVSEAPLLNQSRFYWCTNLLIISSSCLFPFIKTSKQCHHGFEGPCGCFLSKRLILRVHVFRNKQWPATLLQK